MEPENITQDKTRIKTKLKLSDIKTDIEAKDMTKDIQILLSYGFTIKKAYKALIDSNQDVNLALTSLQEKSAQREERKKRKHDQFLKLLQDAGLLTQFEFIVENYQGKRCLKSKHIYNALMSCGNDEKQALTLLNEGKKIKNHKIQRTEDEEMLSVLQLRDWKEGIEQLYLDGNNMLMIDKELRRMCLSRKMSSACEKIAELALAFGIACKVNTYLIYDTSKVQYEDESNGIKFSVVSARPEHESSDDALVVIAGQMNSSDLDKALFVTSDRELQRRLIAEGALNVMKSGVWWKIMRSQLKIVGDSVID